MQINIKSRRSDFKQAVKLRAPALNISAESANNKTEYKKENVTMFDFYRRQITDFPRTETELNAIMEEIANCEDITNAEYSTLYEISIQKLQES